ncbi:HesA/MoeB/ThiF family protein [Alteromonas facilis]|uniref:HesA/MoeB/ThiF family protein n=1 Tax=Alteromonas facilis TaxID=2048004 RepID=UPI000C28ACF9|nr:molybdopterin-synthase adenylyltransferase MoeB [Alteromonas facilis]
MSNVHHSHRQALRYSRQIMLSGFDFEKQEKLLASRVLIIGVGGLGCAAAQYLAAAGVGEMTLIDDDHVELTNLQRQILHHEKSIGQLKTESAKAHLHKLNGDMKITTLHHRLKHDELRVIAPKHDIILDCTDNLDSRRLINQVCVEEGVVLVSGAAIRMEGQVFAYLPDTHSACYHCLSRHLAPLNLTCAEAGVLSPVVGVVGAMQAVEAIKILTHYGQLLANKMLHYDAMHSTWSDFQIERNADCGVCAKS